MNVCAGEAVDACTLHARGTLNSVAAVDVAQTRVSHAPSGIAACGGCTCAAKPMPRARGPLQTDHNFCETESPVSTASTVAYSVVQLLLCRRSNLLGHKLTAVVPVRSLIFGPYICSGVVYFKKICGELVLTADQQGVIQKLRSSMKKVRMHGAMQTHKRWSCQRA